MSFSCSIVSPEQELYSGDVEYVVVPGFDDGNVGFLKGHAPYIGRMGCGTLRVRETGGQEHRWLVYQGFVEFSNNVLTVLASSTQKPEDVTDAMIQQDRDEIPSLPSRTETEYEEKQRRQSILKARVLAKQ